MATYTFFTNPMSRGQIARWALHEVGADYDQVLVEWANKPPALLAANPMAKVPTLIHHSNDGDKIVTESGAICHYLAEMHPESGLLPGDAEMADYFRWMFFVAGPCEQAITAKNFGFDPADPQQQGTVGWGSFSRTMSALQSWFDKNSYVCRERFTMADVYVGSLIDWGLNFGTVPPQEAFVAYAERIQGRKAYKAAKTIDNELIEAPRR